VAITSTAPNLAIALTGTGSLPGQLSITPSSVNFGSITLGNTQSQSATLTASNAPVTVSSVGVSGSQFSVSGISLPVTIATGSSASFAVTYAPTVSGAASANVTFVSNAGNVVESLAGSGAAPQHSVTLGWNTSTSGDVAGYNVYRATSSTGSFTKLNAQLDAAPYDTDSSVQAGATYYYAVTAVSTTGTESTYSNQIQVVVPTP
jgi:TolB protein